MKIYDKLCCDHCIKEICTAPEDISEKVLIFCGPICEYRHFMFITASAEYSQKTEIAK